VIKPALLIEAVTGSENGRREIKTRMYNHNFLFRLMIVLDLWPFRVGH